MSSIYSIEWLITEKCNFTCQYCILYDNTKTPETDMSKISKFLIMVKSKQLATGMEFFMFGGEPFIHPNIGEIIQETKRLRIDFRFQTNLSSFSARKIVALAKQDITIPKLNVSIHFSQSDYDMYHHNIQLLLDNNVPITVLEVMFDGEYVLDLYRRLRNDFPTIDVVLTAVSDFKIDGYADTLRLFNQLRITQLDITFETVLMVHPISGELMERSFIWQEFVDKKWSPKGKPCLLKDKFFMYDSQLNFYNCCLHDNMDDNICKYDTCFLS